MEITKEALDALCVQSIAYDCAVALPEGYKAKQTVTLLTNPPRRSGTYRLDRMDDLLHFVEIADQETKVNSPIYVNDERITAVLNHYADEQQGCPGWADYSAYLPMKFTEEWKRWSRQNERDMSQAEFVEFIEENYDDIIDPSSSDMLTVASKFDMSRKVVFKSAYRASDGETKLTYDETQEAKSGDILLPTAFSIQIPVYEGLEEQTTFQLKARLKVRLKSEGGLVFRYVLVRPDKCQRAAKDAIIAKLEDDTKGAVYAGAQVGYPGDSYNQYDEKQGN